MGAIQYLAQSHLLVVVAGLVGHPQMATVVMEVLEAVLEANGSRYCILVEVETLLLQVPVPRK
jgi:hypothetical protein